MEETQRFVPLVRSKEIRITNLESAKECIHSIKIYHYRKEIREKKLILIKELEKEGSELELLFNKLYEFLPEHKLLEAKKIKNKISETIKKRSKKQKKTTNANKDIDKLELTLSKIEDKLKKI